ncbi:3-dehydroquinate synthase [Bacillus sp. T33-2]|uniref:3-dehydroquinate synthase n=1 Tax=Bacillus sp. T33-2 TaxID=2054168 RepID=UPI000C76F648|nr:3-dehydroquinate synthase [Bacillus sp. T33-2]PLR99743.1 3-dehydroquinate synthase [Bacillus sp. T33-2]
MDSILIETGSKTYPVFVGHGAVEKLRTFLAEKLPGLTSVLIITDETVGRLYLTEVQSMITVQSVHTKIVPDGEKAKTFEVYYDCLSYALEKKLDRKSLIVSLGGGAVGDLAGFVAATFMRGIPFIQVPTTILAHDSAVGGKVAVNHPLGKNMVGAFHQPEAVLYDLKYLQSLPIQEKRSGFAEVIKHSLISDFAFYKWLNERAGSLDDLSPDVLRQSLTKGISIKGAIVSRDEKETGDRAFLNFGHTLGHAVEAECGYGKMTHGEAIAIGMVFALYLSRAVKNLDFDIGEFTDWLMKLGYVTSIPAHLSSERLLDRMKQDKKSVGQSVRFVLLEKIGYPVVAEIPDALLIESLTKFREMGGM